MPYAQGCCRVLREDCFLCARYPCKWNEVQGMCGAGASCLAVDTHLLPSLGNLQVGRAVLQLCLKPPKSPNFEVPKSDPGQVLPE